MQIKIFPYSMRAFKSIHDATLDVSPLAPDPGLTRARVAVLVHAHSSAGVPTRVASLRLSIAEARALADGLVSAADKADALDAGGQA